MYEKTVDMVLDGIKCTLKLLFIEEKDRPQIRELFGAWKKTAFGMKNFKARAVNLPEGISESAFCLNFPNTARVIKVTGGRGSFDVIDLKRKVRIQVKAVSVGEDLTSFGPRSIWDELYWLDFYNNGKLDGTFDVYKIPDDLLYNFKVNIKQTFKDQQQEKRRPRLRIREDIIKPNNLKPIKRCKI